MSSNLLALYCNYVQHLIAITWTLCLKTWQLDSYIDEVIGLLYWDSPTQWCETNPFIVSILRIWVFGHLQTSNGRRAGRLTWGKVCGQGGGHGCIWVERGRNWGMLRAGMGVLVAVTVVWFYPSFCSLTHPMTLLELAPSKCVRWPIDDWPAYQLKILLISCRLFDCSPPPRIMCSVSAAACHNVAGDSTGVLEVTEIEWRIEHKYAVKPHWNIRL